MAPDGFPKDIVESTSKVFQVGKSAIKLTAGLAYQTALSSTLTAKTLRIPMNFATLGGYNVGASHVETSLFSNQALDVFGLGSCSDALRLRLVAGIPCVHSLQLSRPCSANNHRYGGAWHHCVNRCQPHAQTVVENQSLRGPKLSKGIKSMIAHRFTAQANSVIKILSPK